MSAPGELSFTFLACADLKRIWESIAMPTDIYGATVFKNHSAAEDFAQRFTRHCELLAANPELGAPRDQLLHGVFSSSFCNYLIFYRARGKRLEVLRMLRDKGDLGPSA